MSGRIRIRSATKNRATISSVEDLVGGLVSRPRRMSSLLLPSQVGPPAFGDIYTEDTAQCDINEGDIEKFAQLLGIDLEKEPHFRPLVAEGVLAPLPTEWKPCKDRNKDQFYYFNTLTHQSQWEHPLNAVYREKVLQIRQDLAMHRIQNPDLSSRPPKSLPPLKKLGLGRPPSALGSLGGGGQGQNRLNDNLSLNRINASLTQLNRELLEQDGDLPPPSSRMVKKPVTSSLMLTDDEKRLMSQLNIPLKDKQGVKFSLDEDTQLTFDPVEDPLEKVPIKTMKAMYPKGSPSSSSLESDDNSNQRRNPYSAPPPSGATPTSKAQRVPESNLQEQKLALRQEMEEELKKYQEILEYEKKDRQAQMRKELESSLERIRTENETLLQKSRLDFETQTKTELATFQSQQELILETETNKITQIFQSELDQRKAGLQKQHDAALSRLSQDFEEMDTTQKSDLYNKTLAQATQELNAQLKADKDGLRDEQRKQLQQMRDYHATYTEKLKKELASEAAAIQSEHNQRLVRIREKFAKESEQLAAKPTKSASPERVKAPKPEVTIPVPEPHPRKDVKASKPGKLGLPDKSPGKPNPLQKSSEDVQILSEKYTQLEKKYSYLKKELRKITEVATVRQLQSSKGSLKVVGPPKVKTKPLESPRGSETDFKSESPSVISESGDSTTAYPSSYNNPGNGLDSEHRGSGETGERSRNSDASVVDDILEKNNEKLACALKSLETLKQQILEIQQSGAKTGDTEATTKRHDGRRNIRTAPQTTNPYPTSPSPSTAFNNAPTPKRKQVNVSNSSSVGNNNVASQKRVGTGPNSSTSLHKNHNNLTGRRLRPSKSTPELPGLLEAADSDPDSLSGTSPQKIVADAKEFIRTQKERLNLSHPQNPSPTELALAAIHNTYNILSAQKSKPSPESGHLFSDPESSGIGSMTFLPGTHSDPLKSTEKKKISKDIEAICSSLSHLDEQMKLMWNVVNNSPNDPIFDLHPRYPGPSISARDPFSQQNNAYLPLTARISPSNLLNSLDKELKVFKATKEKILSQFANKNTNSVHHPPGDVGSGGDTRDGESLQDKTKDLREWLEKF